MEKTIDRELKRGELINMIREMEVGETLVFPAEKDATVRNTVYNNLFKERTVGSKWKVKRNMDEGRVSVTRLS